jgi:hypothetical protein
MDQLEVGRAKTAQSGMTTPAIIEGFDVEENVALRVRSQITSQIPMRENPLSSSAIP